MRGGKRLFALFTFLTTGFHHLSQLINTCVIALFRKQIPLHGCCTRSAFLLLVNDTQCSVNRTHRTLHVLLSKSLCVLDRFACGHVAMCGDGPVGVKLSCCLIGKQTLTLFFQQSSSFSGVTPSQLQGHAGTAERRFGCAKHVALHRSCAGDTNPSTELIQFFCTVERRVL